MEHYHVYSGVAIILNTAIIALRLCLKRHIVVNTLDFGVKVKSGKKIRTYTIIALLPESKIIG